MHILLVIICGGKLGNNKLPPTVKSLNHYMKVFKPVLKDYLITPALWIILPMLKMFKLYAYLYVK
jgi:hypothetical protein